MGSAAAQDYEASVLTSPPLPHHVDRHLRSGRAERDQRGVSGPARLVRGTLAATAAVGAAALAHTAAGHHSPHVLVMLLAMVVSIPLCTSLSRVRLSRRRLGAAVLLSQLVLHGFFELLPAHAAVPLHVSGGHEHHGHLHHGPQLGSAAELEPGADSAVAHQGLTDPAMAAAHVVAAVGTFFLLRRGEVILAGLMALLSLTPAQLLLSGTEIPAGAPQRSIATPATPSVINAWLGAGPRSLRGPPVLL